MVEVLISDSRVGEIAARVGHTFVGLQKKVGSMIAKHQQVQAEL